MYARLFVLALIAVSANCLDPRWNLLWSDEFTGSTLDATKWQVSNMEGLTSNGEIGYYLPKQVYLSNGNLVILSNPDLSVGSGDSYATGSINTAGLFSVTSGRFEMSAILPSGNGLWPVAFLNSESVCWPAGAEIDILENRGGNITNITATYHFGPTCNVAYQNSSWYNTGFNLSESYHTYALEFNESTITWFFDDIPYKTVSNTSVYEGAPWTFDSSPHFITISTAVGGGFAGYPDTTNVWPQYQVIDYVRVYAWQPCVTGCVHGCCENSTGLCTCNPGASGSFCEFIAPSYSDSFQAVTSNDNFVYQPASDNAIEYVKADGQNELVLSVSNLTLGTGGRWETFQAYGYGEYTYVVKGTNIPGFGLLLWGWTVTAGPFQGFEAGLSGGATGNVFFQSFGLDSDNSILWNTHNPEPNFDASSAFHVYTISYTEDGFSMTVDGGLLATWPGPGLNLPMRFGIELAYEATWYGTGVPYAGPLPVSAYIQAATYTPVTGAPAVCNVPPTPAPTIAPTTGATTTTTGATTATTTTTSATTTTTTTTTGATTTSTTSKGTTSTTTSKGTTSTTTSKGTTTGSPTAAPTAAPTKAPTAAPTPKPTSSATATAAGVATLVMVVGAALLA